MAVLFVTLRRGKVHWRLAFSAAVDRYTRACPSRQVGGLNKGVNNGPKWMAADMDVPHRYVCRCFPARHPQNALPRLGTLTIRLSMWDTLATSRAIFSALLRTLPLLVVPASVTLPPANDTETPSGAAERLMCSTNAEPIFASSSLFASIDRVVARSRNRGLSARSHTAFTQASIDSRPV
jgi:hypothetical protein